MGDFWLFFLLRAVSVLSLGLAMHLYHWQKEPAKASYFVGMAVLLQLQLVLLRLPH